MAPGRRLWLAALSPGRAAAGESRRCLFESMSASPRPGATVLTDVEGLPIDGDLASVHSLARRSRDHRPVPRGAAALNVAGRQALFRTEAAGPGAGAGSDDPRDSRRFVTLYIGITALEIVVLAGLGWTGVDDRMTLFQAVAHAFATIATAGFSTDARSIEPFARGDAVGDRRLHDDGRHQLRTALHGIVRRRFGALRATRSSASTSCCWRSPR